MTLRNGLTEEEKREKYKEKYYRYREKRLAYLREYRNGHPERRYPPSKEVAVEKVKAWRKANPDKAKAISDRANEKRRLAREPRTFLDPEEKKHRARESFKRWKKANPEKVRHFKAKYRASVIQAIPGWVDMDRVAEVYEACARASERLGEPCHVDHIVPLNHELVCGLHWEGNLQVLTARENVEKSNKVWPDMP
jgi:hypothetical protein